MEFEIVNKSFEISDQLFECKMLKIIMTEVQLLSRRLKIYDTLFAKSCDFSLICLQGPVPMDRGKMPHFMMTLIYWRVQLILGFFFFFFL